MMRLAVIGAGAAGLAVVRHAAQIRGCQVVCYEYKNQAGGTWIYTDDVGTDSRGRPVQSSMYKNLKTNLPKEVMAYPDFPFPADGPSFITHKAVLQYFVDYEKKFELNKYIKYGTEVTRVAPTTEEGPPWEVTSQQVASEHQASHPVTEVFDSVFVCNGHYMQPLMPEFPGREAFTGQVMHSHDYRDPAPFRGRTVVCLGAAASGIDIGLEVASQAKQVILSHNKSPLRSPLPTNMRQAPGVTSLSPDGVVFSDGSSAPCDALILCTGYRYDFGFLSTECRPHVEDERVSPMYKHLLHVHYPTLFFIGLCKTIAPFPQYHCQALFCLATLTGKMKLPSTQHMLDDIDKDFRFRQEFGFPPRHAHVMGPLQWAYNDQLAEMASFTAIPERVRKLYDHVHDVRSRNVCGYKQLRYRFPDGSDSFECRD